MSTFLSRSAGARLFYQDLPGRGLPIVFLHAMGCSSSPPGGGTTSRAIAQQSAAQYVKRGHMAMVRKARRQGQEDWATTMALSLPIAVHREATSLVDGSRPTWRKMLGELPMPRTVIFGAQSLPDPDTRALPPLGVRVRIVRNAGHGMAQDIPLASRGRSLQRRNDRTAVRIHCVTGGGSDLPSVKLAGTSAPSGGTTHVPRAAPTTYPGTTRRARRSRVRVPVPPRLPPRKAL